MTNNGPEIIATNKDINIDHLTKNLNIMNNTNIDINKIIKKSIMIKDKLQDLINLIQDLSIIRPYSIKDSYIMNYYI